MADSRRTSLNIGLLGSTGTLVLLTLTLIDDAWVACETVFVPLPVPVAPGWGPVWEVLLLAAPVPAPVPTPVVVVAMTASPAPAPTAIVEMAVARLARDPDPLMVLGAPDLPVATTSSPGTSSVAVFFCFLLWRNRNRDRDRKGQKRGREV